MEEGIEGKGRQKAGKLGEKARKRREGSREKDVEKEEGRKEVACS